MKPLSKTTTRLDLLQQGIVRAYRVAGVLILAFLLFAIAGFFAVRTFHLFNRSWVRPSQVSFHDVRVIETAQAIADARLRRDQLALERAGESRPASQGVLDRRLVEQEQLIARLETSPFAVAPGERRVLAFVPYQNLGRVAPGAPLFGCRLWIVWCEQVGRVSAVLEGEVDGVRPVDGKPLRGVMLKIQLESDWLSEEMLFVGSTPFGRSGS